MYWICFTEMQQEEREKKEKEREKEGGEGVAGALWTSDKIGLSMWKDV